MGYDRGDSFPFDFEPNGSKSKGKLSPRPYPIQCERKWKYSFLSVYNEILASLGIMGGLIKVRDSPINGDTPIGTLP